MAQPVKITPAELEVLKVIWDADRPITSVDIFEGLAKNNDWKKTTVATLISRLVDKDAVSYSQSGRFYYYSPVIEESEYNLMVTQKLMNDLHKGSVKNLVATLFKSKSITQNDIKELRELFDIYEE